MIRHPFTAFALAALVLASLGCSSLQKKSTDKGRRAKTPTTSKVSRKTNDAAKPAKPDQAKTKQTRSKEVDEIVTRDGFR